MRKVFFAATAAGVAMLSGVATALPGDGLAVTQLENVNYARSYSEPNVTCAPRAGGRDLVQRTNYVVGEVYGSDIGIGGGECVSLQAGISYTLNVKVEIFWVDNAKVSHSTGFRNFGSATSVDGVATVPAVTVTGSYPGGSAALGFDHYAKVTLTTTIPGTTPKNMNSPTWFMART